MVHKYKIAMHAHSVWSYDGSWTLKAIARLFGWLGFDAVMMSEHDTGFDPDQFGAYRKFCAAASTRSCQLIPGIEYSSPDNRVHILTWGLDHFLAEHRPVSETLARVSEAGGVAIFAHPIRKSAWEIFDQNWVPYLSGIELWNRKSDGIAPGAEARALLAQTGLRATAGCDFHRLKQLYPLSNRFKSAQPLDEAMLVAALRGGQLCPYAFGRPLVTQAGENRPTARHETAERLRKGAVRLLRGSGSK